MSEADVKKVEDDESEPPRSPDKPPMDPVRKWTFIILGACVVLMVLYLIADRITPYTTQARVHAVVVPIAAEVSGTVIEVTATSNLFVESGELLFQVDRERY